MKAQQASNLAQAQQTVPDVSAASVVVTASPLLRHDEDFYDRLAHGSRWSGRQLFRIRATIPHLPTGRISDLSLRLWLVPSSRVAGRFYEVNLVETTCRYSAKGRYHECPDLVYQHKSSCVHIEAALAQERVY